MIAESLGDRAGQVTLLNRLAVDLANDLEFVHAVEHTEAAVALANETGEERVVATALDSRKLIAAYLGDFAVLGATVATLDGILRRHNDLWILSFALAESAIEPAARGRWDDAVGLIEEALAMKRRIGDQKRAATPAGHAGLGPSKPRRLPRCARHGQEALAMAVEIDHPWWTAWAGANLGATLLELRCPEQATEPLALAHAAAEGIGVRSQLLRSCAHLAWASWLSGDASQAESCFAAPRRSSRASALPTARRGCSEPTPTSPSPACISPGTSRPGRSRCSLHLSPRQTPPDGASPWPSVSSSSAAASGRVAHPVEPRRR